MEIHHHHSRPPAFQPKMNYSPRHGTARPREPPTQMFHPSSSHIQNTTLDTVHGFLITPRPVAHTIKPHKDAFLTLKIPIPQRPLCLIKNCMCNVLYFLFSVLFCSVSLFLIPTDTLSNACHCH
ncbi:hypothetical protein M758_5G133600 [Ceratodon purpureus]|nr:hypothetical protein M758_5G133600 [Ceratodon purpureus]